MSDYTLYQGDCLEVMQGMDAGSVDAVIADVPYFNIVSEAWDKQWEKIEQYQEWIMRFGEACQYVLKDNGSLYIFTDDKVGAYVQVILDRLFLLLNNIVWFKTNNQSIKAVENLRTWAPMTERILFYTPQYDSTGWQAVKLDVNNFQPLREYFRQYQKAIGLGLKQINEKLGHRRAEHAFYWGSTQWDLPTAETYAELGRVFSTNGFERREYEELRREYEELRREYEELRREYEELRRTFNAGDTLDVIVGPIVNQKDNTPHPTTKPPWIIERLVSVSTDPGCLVLDPVMGSGTTGVACGRLGRKFIGIEIDPGYFKIAEQRIKNAYGDYVATDKEKQNGQQSLFDALKQGDLR